VDDTWQERFCKLLGKSFLAVGLLASEEGQQFIEEVKSVCVVYMNLHLVKEVMSTENVVTQMRKLIRSQ